MSVIDSPVTIDEPKVTQEPAPKPVTKKSDKPKRSGHFTKDATLSQVVTAVANARKIDTSRAGKLVRSHIRANFANYTNGKGNTPKWLALAKAKDNRDGNRYPTMPPSVANAIVTHMTSSNKK